MKQILYTQGGDTYELGGGLESWAMSRESKKIKKGEVRYIGGIVMYAYTIERCSFLGLRLDKDIVHWCPVDSELCHNSEKLVTWKNNVWG